jgi:hypothetical protein
MGALLIVFGCSIHILHLSRLAGPRGSKPCRRDAAAGAATKQKPQLAGLRLAWKSLFGWSHFLTEGRTPLFLEMLYKPPRSIAFQLNPNGG